MKKTHDVFRSVNNWNAWHHLKFTLIHGNCLVSFTCQKMSKLKRRIYFSQVFISYKTFLQVY